MDKAMVSISVKMVRRASESLKDNQELSQVVSKLAGSVLNNKHPADEVTALDIHVYRPALYKMGI